MSAPKTWKILAGLALLWVALIFIGAIAGSMRDGVDFIIPNFLAVLWISAHCIVPVCGGVAIGRWTAVTTGKAWLGWVAGLCTLIALFFFFVQLQHAMPRQMRYWIRHIG